MLQREIQPDIFDLLVERPRGLIHVEQGGVGKAGIERQILVGLRYGIVHHIILDPRQHVGVEMRNRFQADGFDQQVVQLDLTLEPPHVHSIASLIITIGQPPDPLGQEQTGYHPKPPALPKGRPQENSQMNGLGDEITDLGDNLQLIATGRKVIELDLAGDLRSRPLLLESFQAITITDITSRGMGHGDE